VIENSAVAAALFLPILLPIVARGKQKIFLFFIFEDPLEPGQKKTNALCNLFFQPRHAID
jgi:hypothetical protein